MCAFYSAFRVAEETGRFRIAPAIIFSFALWCAYTAWKVIP